MGWKSVRDHYRISHMIQVRDGRICIGSPYIPDLIQIDRIGRISKRADDAWNAELVRYQAEFDADPDLLARLVSEEDTFANAIPVYTWEQGEILELECEELGWPNVTHCGRIMYENTFSTDRAETIRRAIKDAEAGVKAFCERAEQLRTELAQNTTRLHASQAAVVKLYYELIAVGGPIHAG
jgi:hypothetical protein